MDRRIRDIKRNRETNSETETVSRGRDRRRESQHRDRMIELDINTWHTKGKLLTKKL